MSGVMRRPWSGLNGIRAGGKFPLTAPFLLQKKRLHHPVDIDVAGKMICFHELSVHGPEDISEMDEVDPLRKPRGQIDKVVLNSRRRMTRYRVSVRSTGNQ